MEFYRRGFVADPGKIIAEGKRNEEDTIVANWILMRLRGRDILQFHRDRRVDSYGELLRLHIPE